MWIEYGRKYGLGDKSEEEGEKWKNYFETQNKKRFKSGGEKILLVVFDQRLRD